MEVCVTAPKVKPAQWSSSRLHFQIGNGFLQVGFLQVGLTVSLLVYLFFTELRVLFT